MSILCNFGLVSRHRGHGGSSICQQYPKNPPEETTTYPQSIPHAHTWFSLKRWQDPTTLTFESLQQLAVVIHGQCPSGFMGPRYLKLTE